MLSKLVLATTLIFASLSTQASVERNITLICEDAQTLFDALNKEYKEKPFFGGLSPNGTSSFVLVNPNKATWSIVAVLPDHTACFFSGGEGFKVDESTLETEGNKKNKL